MKVTVEVEDGLVPALCYAAIEAPSDEATELTAARGAGNILRRYVNCPEIVSEKHAAALAILRDKAMERAVQCAKPGEDSYHDYPLRM